MTLLLRDLAHSCLFLMMILACHVGGVFGQVPIEPDLNPKYPQKLVELIKEEDYIAAEQIAIIKNPDDRSLLAWLRIREALGYEKAGDFVSARRESENVMSDSRSGVNHQGLSDLAGAKIKNFHENEEARNIKDYTPDIPTADIHDTNDQEQGIGPSTARLLLYAFILLPGVMCWLYSKLAKSRKG